LKLLINTLNHMRYNGETATPTCGARVCFAKPSPTADALRGGTAYGSHIFLKFIQLGFGKLWLVWTMLLGVSPLGFKSFVGLRAINRLDKGNYLIYSVTVRALIRHRIRKLQASKKVNKNNW